MKNNKKVAVFVNLSDDTQTLLAKLYKYERDEEWVTVNFANNYKQQSFYSKNNIQFKTSSHYLTKNMHLNAYRSSIKFAKTWYIKTEIEEKFRYDDISLCELFEYKIRLFFSGLFLDIELIQEIFNFEKPDKIFLIVNSLNVFSENSLLEVEAQQSLIIKSLCRQKGIILEVIEAFSTDQKSTKFTISYKMNCIYNKVSLFIKQLYKLIGIFIFLDWKRDIYSYLDYLLSKIYKIFNTIDKDKILSTKNKICFFDFRCMDSVVDMLKKNNDNGLYYLTGLGNHKGFKKNIPCVNLESYKNDIIDSRIHAKIVSFKKLIKQTNIVGYFNDFFKYNRFNFWFIAKIKIENLLEFDFPLIMKGMEYSKKMIDEVGLDLFVSSSDINPLIKAITKIIQNKGRRTLVVLHGIDYFTNEASEHFGKFLVPISANKIAVWGKASKEWFIKNGVLSDRIAVTSCSDFDRYNEMMNVSISLLRFYLKIPRSKKVILYALSHGNKGSRYSYISQTRDEILQQLKEVILEVTSNFDFYLIVRPHPGDCNPDEIIQLINDYGNRNVVFSNMKLVYQLPVIDIFMCYSSSTSVEAMIFNKNVLIYNPSNRPEVMVCFQDGAAIKVTKKEDILPNLTKLLNDEKMKNKLESFRKKYVNKCVNAIDGYATTRITKLIYDMISEKDNGI